MGQFRTLLDVALVIEKISLSLFGKEFTLRVAHDQKGGDRVYLQVEYTSPCTHSGKLENWKGRKWYLSEYMTEDEIIKTAYTAFKSAVEHEVMEGFKVNGIVLFNPHVNYEELLKISHKEVRRA